MHYTKPLSLYSLSVLLAVTIITTKEYSSPFDVKNIEKKLAKITDSLYAYKYETSNSEYNLFLRSIKKEDPGLYEKCLVDSTNWPLRYGEPLIIAYHRHPAFAEYPVVNITYESAIEYCKWLTIQYNTATKRKFNKVEFILPTEKNWIEAAQAGHKGRKWSLENYDALVNKKGMDLYNFKKVGDPFVIRDSTGQPVVVNYLEEKARAFDGVNNRDFYISPVKFFYPNDFGMYNVCGNVAEMIDKKDYAMGGSWNSYGGEITTTSIKEYEMPSPEAGFRVFMKIIQ